jgi:acetyltransferase-like isoleucine patch superfamily enzyme
MKEMNYRKKIKDGNTPLYSYMKRFYVRTRKISFPAPRILYIPIFCITGTLKSICILFYRQFWVIPRFKILMADYGSHLRTGIFVPFVIGKGRIYAGNNVQFYGKVDFLFGSILDRIPEVHIGDRTTIGHGVTFDIASSLQIGQSCLIARQVTFQDCSGHHVHPLKRNLRVALTARQVKSITIGDNVWIGTNAYILPGTTIGSGSVIGAGAIVKGEIPKNSLVRAAPSVVEEIL